MGSNSSEAEGGDAVFPPEWAGLRAVLSRPHIHLTSRLALLFQFVHYDDKALMTGLGQMVVQILKAIKNQRAIPL